jgi:hypothetical protein
MLWYKWNIVESGIEHRITLTINLITNEVYVFTNALLRFYHIIHFQ